MFKFSQLSTFAIALLISCSIGLFSATKGQEINQASGITIAYRSFSSVPTLGLSIDTFTQNIAQLSAQSLGQNEQINFQKIAPKPKVPNDDIVAAVGEGGEIVNGKGFDAAYISGSSLNPAWGFIYNSGIPATNVGFERFLGFLYGDGDQENGLSLAQSLLDKNERNVVIIPIGGNSAQGSGYFPQAVGDTKQKPGIGLKGLCQQPWTFRYLPPAQDVLDLACDRLVGSKKQIKFVTAVPGGEILDQVIENQIQAFEFVTPKDDLALFFGDSEQPNLGDLGLNYAHYPSWHQPFLITYLLINKQVWQNMSPAQQQLIMTSARANVLSSYAQNSRGQGQALQQLLEINQDDQDKNNDMVLAQWSEQDLKLLSAASQEFLNQRNKDLKLSLIDRENYQYVLKTYQTYLQSDQDYWQKLN